MFVHHSISLNLQVDSCQLFQFLVRKMKISHNKPGATAAD